MGCAFVIGNIASGKSTAMRYLERRGARRIDLDELCKSLYVPDSAVLSDLASAFGSDVLDAEGALVPSLLAERAFSSPESARKLDELVYPYLLDELARLLLSSPCSVLAGSDAPLTVVEVSNAAAFTEAFGLADEVVAVSAPVELRRERALGRGMAAADFEARAAVQPSDEELCALASTVIENTGDDQDLFSALEAWLSAFEGRFPCDSEGPRHG